MDIDIILKLYDWTLFTCKNLFRLFSGKAEIYRTWKINASNVLNSSAKSCWDYTILYPLILHRFIYKTVSSFTIYSNTSPVISKYVRKILYLFFLSSGVYNFKVNYLKNKMRHEIWVLISLKNWASFLLQR